MVVTNSDATRPVQRTVAREQLGDDVLIPDEPGNEGYIPKEDRNLPDAPSGSHGEGKGIQAGEEYNSPARRQWSSSTANHGGAACPDCEAMQQEYGVENETGFQSQGGRFDREGGDPE
jgi:hypothetical protein